MIDNAYALVPKKTKCEECYKSLFGEKYILFGCLHGFHRVIYFI